MLVGNNEIVINQATMVAAVQHYLNTVLFKKDKAPTVVSVTQSNYQFHVNTSDSE